MKMCIKRVLAGILAGCIVLSTAMVLPTLYDDGVAIVNEDDEIRPETRRIR